MTIGNLMNYLKENVKVKIKVSAKMRETDDKEMFYGTVRDYKGYIFKSKIDEKHINGIINTPDYLVILI